MLSKLLWLEIDGVLCKRGGNDLLWCCKGECSTEGDCDDEDDVSIVFTAVWLIGTYVCAAVDVVVVISGVDNDGIDVDISTTFVPCEWFVQSYLCERHMNIALNWFVICMLSHRHNQSI